MPLASKRNIVAGKDLGRSRVLDAARMVQPQAPKPLGYRAHAKLAVRPSLEAESQVAVGLFKPGTHDIVDMGGCPLHTPAIMRFIEKSVASR